MSLKSGKSPVAWKEALVLPLLKKKFGLDILFKKFCPVSNLPLVSTLMSQPSITKLIATFAETIFILPISYLIGRIIAQKQRC